MKLNLLKKGIVAMACLPLAMVASVASASSWSKTHTEAFPAGTLKSLGKVADGESLHVVVSLKLRNEPELNGIIGRIMNPRDAMFHSSISHDEVVQKYFPLHNDALAVADYLRGHGFSNIQIASNNMLVEADAKAGAVRTAFNTELERFNREDGSVGYANTRPAQIPAHLSGVVNAVLGLHNLTQYHTHHVMAAASPNAAGAFNPTAFPKAYGISTASTGSNTVVGIISEGDLTQTKSDLAKFESNNGITPVNYTVEGPGGTDTSGTGEWDLDSQDIVAMSGGVKQIIFYDASGLTDSALTSMYNQVVSDNTAKAINVSLGACETSEKSSGGLATDDAIFKSAVAQGQTFFVSSGDSNAKECSIFFGLIKTAGDSYPASSPYVVSVGGTHLTVTSSGTYSGETVWYTKSTEGTGGGPSLVEPKPSWQNGVSALSNSTYRGVPDIALDADPATGALIIYNGSQAQVGGTSLAAPLATALYARAQTAHGNGLGFAASLIYGLPSSDFHDVTSGNNNGYSAGAGWDYCTGFGSPVGDAYVNGL